MVKKKKKATVEKKVVDQKKNTMKLMSLKNQFLWDGTFVKEGQKIEVSLEYGRRLLSLSSSYKGL